MFRALISSIVLVMASGCATVAPPIALVGARADIERLSGDWNGSYESRDTGREGSIWFSLTADEDHAHGDVLMTPSGRGEPYGSGKYGVEPHVSKLLTVRFVAVGDRLVEGVLDSYWDPDCGCWAWTSFRGRLVGDSVAGEFVTHFQSGAEARGRWSVSRRRLSWPRPATGMGAVRGVA